MTALLVLGSVLAYGLIAAFVGAKTHEIAERERWSDPHFAAAMLSFFWPLTVWALLSIGLHNRSKTKRVRLETRRAELDAILKELGG